MLDVMLRREDGPLYSALAAAGSASAHELTMFRARSPLLHLIAVSPSIAPPPPDLSESTHFTGAWMRDSAPRPLSPEIEAFLAAGDPPIVITFGSMTAPDRAALIDAVAAGVKGAGHRMVLQDATAANAAESGSDGVLRTGAVDHRSLLGRALAVIHHGGAGTSHAVASAGVPSIVIPHVGDQPYWAARLHRLGVSPAPLPRKKVTATTVTERVRAASAPSTRAAAWALAEKINAERGVEQAISLLEALTVSQ
jgi:sterol 3beta-glucosyltransferase